MKTFNSTLAIAAIALTSVFGFTSCDKNDDAFNNAPVVQKSNQQAQQTQTDVAQNPQTVSDAYLYVAVTPSQLKYIDATYTLNVDGNKKVVKLSEMNELKDAQRLSYAGGLLQAYDAVPDGKKEIKTLEFHIGNAKKVSIESINYTALSAMADHEIDAYCGALIMSGNNALSNISSRYFRGFDNIAGMVEAFNKRANN